MTTTPHAMTVGELSRRTRVPVKKLRQYTDDGLIYSIGRSPTGYRLFDTDALWCVEVISNLRSLGLTEAQIQRLSALHDHSAQGPTGPHLADMLAQARARTHARIDELQQRLNRIDTFARTHHAALNGHDITAPWGPDPRAKSA
ncbi:MAG: MerR family transcriptional regulator [Thermocrispum sp.]